MIKPIKKPIKINLENAQTLVEFAIVFPIILLITYGIMEFGRMVYIYAAVTGAAREGARYGAASGSFTDPYYKDCTGILNAVERGAILLDIPTGNITIWYDTGPGSSHLPYSCATLPQNTIKMGDRIGVHLFAHYSPIIPFLGLSGFDITSENARTILVNVQVVPPTYP